MVASYPGSVRAFATHLNSVEVIDASHVNDLQNEVDAVEGVLGINPQISSAGTGSTLGAWSASSRTYPTVADRLANAESGHTADSHTQYVRFAGNETVTGAKSFTATDTGFGSGVGTSNGNVNLSSGASGGQAAVQFIEGTSLSRWSLAFAQGTTTLRVRDLVNARDHVVYTPGTSAATASTAFAGGVSVAGTAAVTGTSTFTGAVTANGGVTTTNLTVSGTLTLAAGTGVAASVSAVGDTASAGSSGTIARADHVHGREVFATTTVADDGGPAAAGTAVSVSRGDHKHTVTLGGPTAETSFGIAPAAGTSNALARADHTHGSPPAPTAASVGAVALTGSTMTGNLVAPRVTGSAAVGVNDGLITKATGGAYAFDAALTAPTVTGTNGVFDGVNRVYSTSNPPPSAAPVVIVPFYVGGSIGTGLRRPVYIATVPLTIRGARSISYAGTGTYSIYVNGAGISGASGAFGTAQALYSFTAVNLNAGDRIQLSVDTASTDATDLSVTVDVVTR